MNSWKLAGLGLALLISVIAIPPRSPAESPHPMDDPVINFQGRVEVGDVGYSGNTWFALTIGNEDMATTYWSSFASVSAVEGIFNILIGGNTEDPLTDDVFTHLEDMYLRVAFSTDGINYETLSPDQQIVSVPYAVNADLLDGLESPNSAFVGLTDTQTVLNKTLVQPEIDTVFFTPGALPGTPSAGYIAFDSSDNTMKYYNGTDWIEMSGSGGGGGDDDWIFISGSTAADPIYHTGTVIIGTDAIADDELVRINSAGPAPALRVEGTGLGTGADGSMIQLYRHDNGRILTATTQATTQHGVWVTSTTLTTGSLIAAYANSPVLTSGYVIRAEQAFTEATGIAVYAYQAGVGKAIQATVGAGSAGAANAIMVNQGSNSDSNIDSDEGGAIHIINTNNVYGGLTIYSNQGADQAAPLATLKTGATAFDQALLALDPAVGGNAPHLYLKGIDGPTPETLAAGMVYMDNDGYLYYAANDQGFNVLNSRWTYRAGSRVADDQFTVAATTVNSNAFQEGRPVRYGAAAGTWSYGVVTDYTGGTVTIAGAPMTAGLDAYIQSGTPELVRQASFYKPGAVAVGNDYMGLATWQLEDSYVVRVTGQLEGAPADDDVSIQIGIDGASNDLLTSTLDLADTNQGSSDTGIDTAEYKLDFGDRIYVNLDSVGSTTPGSGLLVTLEVVTP